MLVFLLDTYIFLMQRKEGSSKMDGNVHSPSLFGLSESSLAWSLFPELKNGVPLQP